MHAGYPWKAYTSSDGGGVDRVSTALVSWATTAVLGSNNSSGGSGNNSSGFNNNTTCVTEPRYEWANTYLGECVKNDLQLIGLFLGLLSMACWLVAQSP